LAQIIPENLGELKMQVGRVGSLLTNYYFYLLVLLFILAYFLAVEWPAGKNETPLIGSVAGLILVIAVFWIIYFTNLRVVHADIAFKMAEPFNKVDQWPIATELYKYTNSLAPDQDHYYLFLGRSYLEQAKSESDSAQQDLLINEAESELKIAQRKNPLNTDHTANLGRLYSWWASRAAEPQTRQERGQTASNYYTTATTLSPQNSNLWGEWAILYLDVLNNPKEAYKRLDRALALDPRYNWTQGLMGDYYFRTGRVITETVAKESSLQKALDHYEQALAVSKSWETQARIGYLIGKGNTYTELGQFSEAVSAYEEAVALKPATSDLWRIEETIARTYVLVGDKENALAHANAALEAAPTEQAARINQFINEINNPPE
jgi:tetratricopeptide (TPR) repeat protein